ncbi:AraC family transcriptional regulator [Streptomyces sp. 549]|uniref:AraC family transcriptional regulator n=1 Tax=Streptomyces sp. 549 TaxID=3049076 RepID=UPI0024C24504|nr:AraC family transcriptional regulator [Streptomyces sp. 549]MDK1474304.1 AraC family transcriptional regulator [Streptomyces sp. 549]
MDVLSELLDGTRARGGMFHQVVMDPPWSLHIKDEAPLGLLTMARGTAWLTPDGADPVRLRPGDIAVLRGPDPYTVSDVPGRAPDMVVHPGDRCTTPEGEELCEALALGVRTWGRNRDGADLLVNGTYQVQGGISRRLLAALPQFLVLPQESCGCPLLPLFADELARDAPGQQAVLDRLLDLTLIATLRAWFDRPDGDAPRWYRAQGDPVVGPALNLLHLHPARPWTVASLAAAVGVSRAALARRFTDLVGEPPMSYLTGWRIDLAGDLLREPGVTVASVARQVGYANAFALSAAFKRLRGLSPSEFRAGPTATGGAAEGGQPERALVRAPARVTAPEPGLRAVVR